MQDTKRLEEQVKEARRAYFKDWRAKNKDKVRKHSENYWLRWAERQNKKAGENDVDQ